MCSIPYYCRRSEVSFMFHLRQRHANRVGWARTPRAVARTHARAVGLGFAGRMFTLVAGVFTLSKTFQLKKFNSLDPSNPALLNLHFLNLSVISQHSSKYSLSYSLQSVQRKAPTSLTTRPRASIPSASGSLPVDPTIPYVPKLDVLRSTSLQTLPDLPHEQHTSPAWPTG